MMKFSEHGFVPQLYDNKSPRNESLNYFENQKTLEKMIPSIKVVENENNNLKG